MQIILIIANDALSLKNLGQTSSSSRRIPRPSSADRLAPEIMRAQGRPGAGRTHGPPAKEMLAAGTTGTRRIIRPSLRNGFNGCFAFSLVRRAFWPPSPARRVSDVASLTSASGCQDRAT
ncbi:hypothetical protein ACQR1I_29715 [Bradyrhizobium sp. HKCCYLS2038]|uniref:hypothetical protein n=1 Tax=unclassified Bradyrhizobium TaxID=2631580 RepID=UPI003EBF821C